MASRLDSWLSRRLSRRNRPEPVTETPDGEVEVQRPSQHPTNPDRGPHPGPHPGQHPQPHPSQGRPPPVAPVHSSAPPTTTPATSSGTLEVDLHNDSSSSAVFAYITGQAIENGNALFFLSADGVTPYFPPNPSRPQTPIGANVAIPLGAPGHTVSARIPYLAGARIWFSMGGTLQFFVNPGGGLVEPSIFNPSDPNINTNFGFCEFTFNSVQLFANITYVDFVSDVPIALTLEETSGARQHVSGMPADGLARVCSALRAQTAKDRRHWGSLIIEKDGKELRALSPNSGITLNASLFSSYWNDYVKQVYSEYTSRPLTVDTQASYGNVNGQVNSAGVLDFGAGGSFGRPSAADIFSNSTGPFATGGSNETNAIIPRLAAAFNRSTLLLSSNTPDGTRPAQYYQHPTTNHYARICHAVNVDGLGYAFPYDDVVPDGGKPQEGAVYSSTPAVFTVAVGGTHAHAA